MDGEEPLHQVLLPLVRVHSPYFESMRATPSSSPDRCAHHHETHALRAHNAPLLSAHPRISSSHKDPLHAPRVCRPHLVPHANARTVRAGHALCTDPEPLLRIYLHSLLVPLLSTNCACALRASMTRTKKLPLWPHARAPHQRDEHLCARTLPRAHSTTCLPTKASQEAESLFGILSNTFPAQHLHLQVFTSKTPMLHFRRTQNSSPASRALKSPSSIMCAHRYPRAYNASRTPPSLP